MDILAEVYNIVSLIESITFFIMHLKFTSKLLVIPHSMIVVSAHRVHEPLSEYIPVNIILLYLQSKPNSGLADLRPLNFG